MKFTNTKRLQGGQAMIMATVFFIIISTTVILGLGAMISSSQKLVSQALLSRKSYYLAESGAEEASYDLIHNVPVGDPPVIDGQSPNVVVNPNGDSQTVVSTSNAYDITREVQVTLTTGTTSVQILSWKETQ